MLFLQFYLFIYSTLQIVIDNSKKRNRRAVTNTTRRIPMQCFTSLQMTPLLLVCPNLNQGLCGQGTDVVYDLSGNAADVEVTQRASARGQCLILS